MKWLWIMEIGKTLMKIKLEKDKHPFKGAISLYDKGAKVKNRFTGQETELNALELSIYDTIIGCEQFGDWENVRLGLDWVRKFNANAYYVLLD